MTTITRQQMIAALNRVIPWSSDAFNQDGKTLTGEELTVILAELQKVDERTLPELPKGMKYHLISFGTDNHTWTIPCDQNQKQAILDAISKITHRWR